MGWPCVYQGMQQTSGKQSYASQPSSSTLLLACVEIKQMLWTACVRRQACVVIVMCNLLLHVYHGKQSNLFWVCDVPQLYADAALRPGSRHAVVCVKSHLRRQVPTWVQVSRRLAWMHVLRTLEQLCKRSWNRMRWIWMARPIRSACQACPGLHTSCVILCVILLRCNAELLLGMFLLKHCCCGQLTNTEYLQSVSTMCCKWVNS